jgi:hypothetical protein
MHEAGDPQAWRLAQSSITPDFLVGMDEIPSLSVTGMSRTGTEFIDRGPA